LHIRLARPASGCFFGGKNPRAASFACGPQKDQLAIWPLFDVALRERNREVPQYVSWGLKSSFKKEVFFDLVRR